MLLNDAKCKNAVLKEKAYKLNDGDGLRLLINPNGSKYWRLKYRYLGSEKQLALGVYPEVSLADARNKRAAARALVRDGKDPSIEKKRTRQLAILSAETTFQGVADEWFNHMKSRWASRHAQNLLSRLRADAYPALGHMPIADIDGQLVLAMVRKIESRGACDIARRTLQCCRQIFTYAIATGRARYNPASDLNKLLKPTLKSHFAAIDHRGIPDFIAALDNNEARLTPQTRLATKLLMLTFVRTNELIKATWDEFDLEQAEWRIPAARMKKRRDHIVPLAAQTVEILRRLKAEAGFGQWVLPSRSFPKKHMSDCTILNAIKRMGYTGVMTGHGFRSLAMSTIKEKLDYRHEVIDRQLAHVPTKINKAYDRAEFLEDRRRMMQDWADYLDSTQDAPKRPELRLVA